MSMGGIISQRDVEKSPHQYGLRSSLLALQREVERGEKISEERAEANVAFAVSVINDESSTVRDKLRATELIESMRARGIAVAMHLDKMERPAQVSVEHRHLVKVIKGVDPEAL